MHKLISKLNIKRGQTSPTDWQDFLPHSTKNLTRQEAKQEAINLSWDSHVESSQ